MNERDQKMRGLDEVAGNCAALKSRMAARSVTRVFDDALRPFDLRITQFTLLVAIKLGPPGSISRFAEELAMERTTLTRNLQLLEKDGLIKLGPEGYRRARSLNLTPSGEAKLKAVLPTWQATQERVVKSLGEPTWAKAHHLLTQLSQMD